MMDLVVEIECKKDGEEVFFYDTYLDDLRTGSGGIISTILRNTKRVDTVVVYLSNEKELLRLWESPATPETCGEKLLNTFKEINQYIEGSKHENQGANAISSNPNGAIRQSAA